MTAALILSLSGCQKSQTNEINSAADDELELSQSATNNRNARLGQVVFKAAPEPVIESDPPAPPNLPLTSDELAQVVDKALESGEVDALIRGKTALMHAAELGDLAAAQRLIAAGANVNAVSETEFFINDGLVRSVELNAGKTALMYAAYRGNAELVAALIDAGANLHATDGGAKINPFCNEEESTSPISWELQRAHGYYDSLIFEKLSTDAEMPTTERLAYTALHYAILGATPLETAQRLIKSGILTSNSNENASYIELAIALEKTDILELLLNAGLKPTSEEIELIAATTGNVALYKKLLPYLDPEVTLMSRQFEAAVKYGRASILDEYLNMGFDLSSTNDSTPSLVRLAAQNHNAETLRWLLAHGSTIAEKETIAELIDVAASVKRVNSANCHIEDSGTLKSLIDAGLGSQEDYERALIGQFDFCAFDGLLTISETRAMTTRIQQLLAAGADPFVHDSTGVTPFEIAIEKGYLNSAKTLLSAMRANPEKLRNALTTILANTQGPVIHSRAFKDLVAVYPEIPDQLREIDIDIEELKDDTPYNYGDSYYERKHKTPRPINPIYCPVQPSSKQLTLTSSANLNIVCQNFPGIAGCE